MRVWENHFILNWTTLNRKMSHWLEKIIAWLIPKGKWSLSLEESSNRQMNRWGKSRCLWKLITLIPISLNSFQPQQTLIKTLTDLQDISLSIIIQGIWLVGEGIWICVWTSQLITSLVYWKIQLAILIDT